MPSQPSHTRSPDRFAIEGALRESKIVAKEIDGDTVRFTPGTVTDDAVTAFSGKLAASGYIVTRRTRKPTASDELFVTEVTIGRPRGFHRN